jgi:hypothetical protein
MEIKVPFLSGLLRKLFDIKCKSCNLLCKSSSYKNFLETLNFELVTRSKNHFGILGTRASELNRTFSKEEIQMTKKKKTHEKMLTISSNKGNAN